MDTDLIRYMAGALIAGLCAAALGVPGLVLGLILAFAYHSMRKR